MYPFIDMQLRLRPANPISNLIPLRLGWFHPSYSPPINKELIRERRQKNSAWKHGGIKCFFKRKGDGLSHWKLVKTLVCKIGSQENVLGGMLYVETFYDVL